MDKTTVQNKLDDLQKQSGDFSAEAAGALQTVQAQLTASVSLADSLRHEQGELERQLAEETAKLSNDQQLMQALQSQITKANEEQAGLGQIQGPAGAGPCRIQG